MLISSDGRSWLTGSLTTVQFEMSCADGKAFSSVRDAFADDHACAVPKEKSFLNNMIALRLHAANPTSLFESRHSSGAG